ncbi:MAG TPA: hypothetical protein VM452_20150 [Caulifigura sp.]|nr:hypothetical protein [Caulifigura sp.]
MAGRTPDPDLIKVTELFLVPSSFLVAALGTADTNIHRAAVSLLGLVVSGLWWIAANDAFQHADDASTERVEHPVRTRVLHRLPLAFAAGWLVSVIAHGMLWNRPLGVN